MTKGKWDCGNDHLTFRLWKIIYLKGAKNKLSGPVTV